MSAHWSTQVFKLWWRDKGTGRARVSFAKTKDSLLRRAAKVWHADMDAALFAPDGSRLPLTPPEDVRKKRARKGRKPTPAKVALASAA